MYSLKQIITHNTEIVLPKCMYILKNILNFEVPSDELNINLQVVKLLKSPNKEMIELEERQENLLKKLDLLHGRIKSISNFCQQQSQTIIENDKLSEAKIPALDEIVVVASPESVPLFIGLFIKKANVNLSWHIHSSVPTGQTTKIKDFIETLPKSTRNEQINVRLIFKNVSANSELKVSSMDLPIVGNVNILRFLSLMFPRVLPNDNDFQTDGLLDMCHILERTTEKNREAMVKIILANYNTWVYNKHFSIVDVALFNIVKQWKNCPKYIPKDWYDRCNQMLSK